MRDFSLKTFFKRHSFLISIVTVGVLAVFVSLLEMQFQSREPIAKEQKTADTYIPAGHVLVPIEVQNARALDSILGAFGVVDLYLPKTPTHSKPRRIARQIKILRAPLNPQKFAVLAPERDSARLVQGETPFFVVVQNPQKSATRIVEAKIKKARRQRIQFAEE